MADEQQKEETGKVEPTDIEQRASSMGWRPKEDWQGNEDDFIDAKEFVRRKPLFDKIDQTTKRLKSVEETLTNLASHHQKVKEVEYQRAVKALRDEKRAALQEGDAVKALEFDDQIDTLATEHQVEVTELQKQAAQEAQKNTGQSADFLTWVKSNDWYLKDEDMHDFADGAAAAFIQRAKIKGTQLTEQEVFDNVLEKVKRAYPEKFENPNRNKPGAVNSGDRGGKGGKTSFAPSEAEKEAARSFVKQGVFKTEDEYYKELRQIEENK